MRTVMPCPPNGAQTAVVLALGQSNASNSSSPDEPHTRASASVANFFDGVCYAAADPLLGADGAANSVWTLVADRLVARHAFANVVVAPFAISTTSIKDWQEKPFFTARLDRVVSDLKAANLPPTAVVWFQGEAEALAGTTTDDYVSRFTAFARAIRARGVTAPIFVSTTTRCQSSPNEAIRNAQMRLRGTEGIRPGPDTDALGLAYRYDGCHFTAEGRAAAADLWTEALIRH